MKIKIISAPNQKAMGGGLSPNPFYGLGSGATSYSLMSDYLTVKNRQTDTKNKMTPFYFGSNNSFAEGGHTHGANFSNGTTQINAGSTHEMNPNEGVQIGVDPEGTPNLVEEGEVVWNDFVFSNRINCPEKVKKLFGIRGKNSITFADAAKKIQAESSERPNDPISLAGLNANLTSLAQAQESLKAEQKAKEAQRQFAQLSPEEQQMIMAQIQQSQEPSQDGTNMAAMGGSFFKKLPPRQKEPTEEEMYAAAVQMLQEYQENPEEASKKYTQEQLQQASQIYQTVNAKKKGAKNTKADGGVLSLFKSMMGGSTTGNSTSLLNGAGDIPTNSSASVSASAGNVKANGGKVNRFDDGGYARLMNILGLRSDSELDALLKEHNIDPDNIYLSGNKGRNLYVGALNRFLESESFKKANPSFTHAIGTSGMTLNPTSTSPSGSLTFDFTHGGWGKEDWNHWNGSEDAAWKEAVQKGLISEGATGQQIAEALVQTDAYKRGTAWLQDSEDNRLTYLKAILNSPDAPDAAKKHAKKFINENGWLDGKARDYNTIFGTVRTSHPGTYWKTPNEMIRENVSRRYILNPGTKQYETLYGDDISGLTVDGTYSWGDGDGITNYTNTYYSKPADTKPESKKPETPLNTIYKKRDAAGSTPYEDLDLGETSITEWLNTHPGYQLLEAKDEKDGTVTRYIDPVAKTKNKWEFLRYAPTLGGAVGLGLMAAGVGKPDYTALDAAVDINSGNPMMVESTPIGNYLRFNPLDINYEQNKLDAASAATRRDIINTAGTRGAAMAGILASDYNAQQSSGDLFRKALEYNDAQRQAVETFNRGTNQFNAEADLKAQMANQDAFNRNRQVQAQLSLDAAKAKLNMDSQWTNGIYGNLGNIFTSLGNIGTENFRMNRIGDMANSEIFGTLSDSLADNIYKKMKGNGKSKGGKINKKNKKGGYTY